MCCQWHEYQFPLLKTHKNRLAALLTATPAAFVSTYILMANEVFRPGAKVGYPVGIIFAAALFVICFLHSMVPDCRNTSQQQKQSRLAAFYSSLYLRKAGKP